MSLWAPHTDGHMTISHQGLSGSACFDPAWSFSLGFTSSRKPSPLLLEDPASLEIKDHLANWAQSSVATKVWHHEHCPQRRLLTSCDHTALSNHVSNRLLPGSIK